MNPFDRQILCAGFYFVDCDGGRDGSLSAVIVAKNDEVRLAAMDLLNIRLNQPDMFTKHFVGTNESYLDHVWEVISTLFCHHFNQDKVIRIPFNKLQRMDDDDEAVEFANNFVELLEGVWGDSWISQDHLKQ